MANEVASENSRKISRKQSGLDPDAPKKAKQYDRNLFLLPFSPS